MTVFPERFSVLLERLTPGGFDAQRNPVDVWACAVEVPVFGWYAASTDSEVRDARSGVVRRFEVLAASGFAGARDRVTIPGEGVFTVVGMPEPFNYGPFGFAPGFRVRVEQVIG